MSDREKEEETNPARDKAEEGQVCRHLYNLLSDTYLRKSIVRLARDIHEEAGKEFTAQAAAECLQPLNQISFLQVPCVKTVMAKHNKEVLSSQTKISSYVHNKEGTPRQSFVYLDADVCTDLNSNMDGFLQKLVSAIQFVSGAKFESLLLYRMLKSPGQADAILDEAGIKQYTYRGDTFVSFLPKDGSFVPVINHRLLDNELYEFCEGERAAFEVYDPFMVCEDSEDNTPVYIYITVMNEICDYDTDTVFAKHYHIDLGPDRGEADVSSTRLYKIIGKTSQTFMDMSSSKIQDQQILSSQEKADETVDLSAVLKDLREMLTEARQICTDDEFRCVTKRLVRKWHPDKHSGKESVCTLLTEAIFQYAELLNQGEALPKDDISVSRTQDNVDGQVARSSLKAFGQSDAHRGSHAELQMGHDMFKVVHWGSHSVFQMDGDTANPQPGEGWRWWRTARCDLDAATDFQGACERGRNWICFLCQQAVEKALKGVLYLRDADNDSLQSHSLLRLARQIKDVPLQQLAQEMESRMGSHTRMRYPDVLVYPMVPADVYSNDHVNRARDLAWRAVDRAQWLMKSS